MIGRFAPAMRDFLKQESAGGIILIFAAIAAMVVANSPLLGSYKSMLDTPVIAGIGSVVIDKPLLLWINDGLMAVFFFLVGLEVKREIIDGQLSSWNRASLPLVAAIGGMAIPALIFVAVNQGSPENISGWAIPAATDIAFALGVLSLLGPRVPVALKALLLAIAVIDDIGAITVIALFYTSEIDPAMLGGAAAVFAAMLVVGRMKVSTSIPYVLLFIVLWVFVLKSGVHATLAGVAAAFTVPMQARDGTRLLERMEHGLHPWSAFLIIPVFGFANAGVSLAGVSPSALLDPLPLGIALGLLVGKQLGIFGFAFAAVKLKLASLPADVTWKQVHAMSLLAAIGFTMSLFIGNLAFDDLARIDAVKIGVLTGSLVAALAGYALLRATTTKPDPKEFPNPEGDVSN
ncbi:Na+/H+ antiporter NhaA [Alteriqipengyuania sp. WL0013]|uniref:Na+/H+ antiporter NhaA n=1 Tax=Alteriqipengyuania sp. WL0013 TaxID=3110773 RepID=UPI002D184AB9|nr:Na+/H+ antiporter NhaA [Alteriqipengyuania sp. WL0013]MEB3414752.1 Na+/H+ antiporter NhaA [Alteriqipengyuania sp. WL0013]